MKDGWCEAAVGKGWLWWRPERMAQEGVASAVIARLRPAAGTGVELRGLPRGVAGAALPGRRPLADPRPAGEGGHGGALVAAESDGPAAGDREIAVCAAGRRNERAIRRCALAGGAAQPRSGGGARRASRRWRRVDRERRGGAPLLRRGVRELSGGSRAGAADGNPAPLRPQCGSAPPTRAQRLNRVRIPPPDGVDHADQKRSFQLGKRLAQGRVGGRIRYRFQRITSVVRNPIVALQ